MPRHAGLFRVALSAAEQVGPCGQTKQKKSCLAFIWLFGLNNAMESISRLFKALTDEIRLRIVGLLSEGELCVCDLTHVGMPQSTISRHQPAKRRENA